MSTPSYDEFYDAILDLLSDGGIHNASETKAYCAEAFHLTQEEREHMLPNGTQTVLGNRVGWARTDLKKAGLITSPKRAHYKITDTGHQILISLQQKVLQEKIDG